MSIIGVWGGAMQQDLESLLLHHGFRDHNAMSTLPLQEDALSFDVIDTEGNVLTFTIRLTVDTGRTVRL